MQRSQIPPFETSGKIFQHLAHFSPLAKSISTAISLIVSILKALPGIFDVYKENDETIPISAMSIPFNISFFSKETYKLTFAWRLDPIVFSARFISSAPVITFLTSFIRFHLSANFLLLKLEGILRNSSR